jgi:predicted O-methyltransferase YrrM
MNPNLLFEGFGRHPVTLTELPSGPWSSPVADVVTLAKIAVSVKPRRVLEVGSYRGYTTRLLAEHTAPDARIVAFDRDPRHGEAYRDTPLAAKIERRIGEVDSAAFSADAPGSFDLIFLDADHAYAAVKHDTEVLLPLLAPGGIFLWHDYANWGKFSGKNGVPEYLHELARSRPLAAISGSLLAAYRPAWSSEGGARELDKARQDLAANRPGDDPWATEGLRG